MPLISTSMTSSPNFLLPLLQHFELSVGKKSVMGMHIICFELITKITSVLAENVFHHDRQATC